MGAGAGRILGDYRKCLPIDDFRYSGVKPSAPPEAAFLSEKPTHGSGAPGFPSRWLASVRAAR
jgi:hypothetical protein